MCTSPPKMPEMEPTPPPVPQNEVADPTPVAPSKAPEMVNEDPVKLKKQSKRRQQQKASSGTGALKIPLATGAKTGTSSGLNIPT